MIDKALKNLPKTLEDTYARVLSKIPEYYHNTARCILLLLAYSFRPLTIQEVAAAASLPEPRDVLRICTSSLVTSVEVGADLESPRSREVVRFDHFSVKEYVISSSIRNSNNKDFYMCPKLAHLTIARDSISGLLQMKYEDSGKIIYRDTLEYSARYWYKHVNEADCLEAVVAESQDEIDQSKHRAEKLRLQIHRIFCEEYRQSLFSLVCTWHKTMDPFLILDRRNSDGLGLQPWEFPIQNLANPLYYAALMGLPDNVTRLLNQGVDINAKGGGAGTALVAAASRGHYKVLELLLNKKAEISTSGLNMIMKSVNTNGVRVLELLLSQETTIKIGDDLVKAGMMNKNATPELIETLL